MKITLADIGFAQRAAFDKAWPTLKQKHEAQSKLRYPWGHSTVDKTAIHQVVNGHVERQIKPKYNWHTTLWIIAQRVKRNEPWIGAENWFPDSPSSERHIILMGRVARRWRRAQWRLK